MATEEKGDRGRALSAASDPGPRPAGGPTRRMTMSRPLRVFIIYAHEDDKFRVPRILGEE